MRRPACVASQARPGGLGEPSGPTTGACLQWLDADSQGGRNPAGVAPSGAHALSRKYGPEALNPAVARPQAPRFVVTRIASQPTTPAPAGAPLPLIREGWTAAHLGRIAPRDRARLAV